MIEPEHERLRALLREAVLGELGWRERRRLDRHVAGCAECRRSRDDLHRAWYALGAVLPESAPPAHLKARVLDRYRAAHAVSGRADRRSLWARAGDALRLPAAPRLRPAFALALAILIPLSAVAVIGLRPAVPSLAAETTLTIVRGDAELSTDGGSAWAAARDLARLGPGERVRMGSAGRGIITFFDGSTVSLGPLAEVAIDALSRGEGADRIAIAQHSGASWTSIAPGRHPVTFVLHTSSVSARARGTAFETAVNGGVTTLRAHEGELDLDAAGRTLRLRAGEVAVARPNELPEIAAAADLVRISVRTSAPPLVVDPLGLACGTASDGSLVRQLPRCLVDGDAERATIGMPAGGRFIVAVRPGRDRRIELRVVLTDHGVTQEESVGAESAPGELWLTSFDLEIGPDGRLRLSRIAPFARADGVPARIVLRPSGSGPALASADPTEHPRTATPRPAETPEPSRTAEPTRTPQPRTPEPARTPEPTETPEPSRTPEPSPTPTPSPTRTAEPSRSPTPSPTRTP